QVDERGLAGAVRADERVASAHGERERDAVDGDERSEGTRQVLGMEGWGRRGGHLDPVPEGAAPVTHPRMPPRAKSTKTTSPRPSQNSQYTGFFAARKSCASMNTAVPMIAP